MKLVTCKDGTKFRIETRFCLKRLPVMSTHWETMGFNEVVKESQDLLKYHVASHGGMESQSDIPRRLKD